MSDIIYEYSDEDALNDGVLVAIGHLKIEIQAIRVDRISQALWLKIVTGMPTDEEGGLDTSELIQRIGDIIAAPAQRQNNLIQIDTRYGLVWAVENERRRWTLMLPSDY